MLGLQKRRLERAVASTYLSVRLCATRNLSVMVFLEMCGRFTLKSPDRIKFDRANHSNLPPLFPRYNIAPSQSVLAIIQYGVEREAAFLQWGLVPSWSKEPKGFINARAETIEEKPSFSESFQKRRCLVLADGFFEWDQKSGKLKHRTIFKLTMKRRLRLPASGMSGAEIKCQ